MQVMVFMSKAADNPGHKPTLLALRPTAEAAIPAHLRHLEWTYYAEMDSSDTSLGGPSAGVDEKVAAQGYAEVPFRLRPQAD